MAPLVREDSGHVAVAVADLTTGAQAAYGGSEEFVTASIVKVDILATLLYQLQQAGQVLTFQEQKLAVTMIENSDNDSASDLFDGVNRAEGVDDANRVFGLQQTAAGTRHWGGIAVVEAVARAAAASITASWQDRHDRRAQELHVQVGRWRPRRARERCMLTANLLAGRCGGESHQAARSGCALACS